MRIKHIIIICGLLVAATLNGCSQGNGEFIGITPPEKVSIIPTQTTDLILVEQSSVVDAQNVSFSAGEIQTPEPTLSAELSVTAKPTQAQGKSTPEETAAPKPKATSKPTVSPKPTSTPRPPAAPKPTATPKPTVSPKPIAVPTPIATPRPTATPMPTAIPAPVLTSTPMATPTPTVMPAPPMVFFTPELQTGRTICNTCGADITGNIAAHGDGHLLNGENFSYRVE